MEAIKKLNSNTFKEFIKLGDLKENQKYTINNFSINNSKFGPQLCVEVDNTYCLSLPKRFLTDFTENECKLINEHSDKITMIYKGTKKLNNGKTFHLLDFE